MKRILSIIAIWSVLFTACEPIAETPSNAESNLMVATNIVTMSAAGGMGEIIYTISQPTEGAVLEATSTSEWISDITVGEKITFEVDANTTTEQRVGFINISYGAEEYTVGVQQVGKDEGNSSIKISLTPRKITAPAMGGSQSVSYLISGAEEGAIAKVKATDEWIGDIEVDAENITFVVAKNSSTQKRETKIQVSYSTAEATITVTQEGAVNEVILTASTTTARVGQSVTLRVEYAGEDVTSEAKICDYYTHKEFSNPVTFSEVGEYALYAKYNDMSSKLVSITVFTASAPDFPVDSDASNYNFKYRMLLIDHTGTDCGYCPLMMSSLKQLEDNPAYNDYFNIAMAHSYNSSDPSYSSTAVTISGYYRNTIKTLTGYPTLTYNYQYKESAGSNITYILNNFNKLKKESQDAGVAVAAKLDGDKVVVSASLKSKRARHFKFNVLLLEDNIYGSQYGATESWMNYHNNAIRSSYAPITSSDISGTEWGYVGASSVQHKVIELPIENSRIVKSNCKVLVIITAQDANYDNKYEVVNTTMCELDQSVPFEYRDAQ